MTSSAGGPGPSTDPSWWNIVGVALGAIGAPILLQKMMDHLFGHRKTKAEAELMMAQARKMESDAEDGATGHVAEFEKAVNERVKAVLDSWERHVTLLTERIQAQQDEIHGMRQEVVELRKALDATTRELHQVRLGRIAGA